MLDFFNHRRSMSEKEAQGRTIVAFTDGLASWILGLFGIVGKTSPQQRREDEEIAKMLGEDPDVRRRRIESGESD